MKSAQDLKEDIIEINTDTAAIAANTEHGLVISEETKKLIQAIDDEDVEKISASIKAGADLKAIVYDDTAQNFETSAKQGEELEKATLLNHAVYTLNYDVIKLLLENGVIVNNEKEIRSPIECLMMALNYIVVSEVMGTPAQKPVRLFSVALPIKTDVIFSQDTINSAHKILDLLLCYGVNPNFEWTKLFNEGYKYLIETLNDQRIARGTQEAFPEVSDAKLAAKTNLNGIEKALLSGVARAGTWVMLQRSKTKPDFANFVCTVPQVKIKAIAAAKEINAEKDSYQSLLSTTLSGFPNWVVALNRLIIEYAHSFSNEVAKNRLKTNRIVGFWQHSPEKEFIAREKNRVIQTYHYQKELEPIKNVLTEKPHQIVLDYLIDPTQAPGYLRHK